MNVPAVGFVRWRNCTVIFWGDWMLDRRFCELRRICSEGFYQRVKRVGSAHEQHNHRQITFVSATHQSTLSENKHVLAENPCNYAGWGDWRKNEDPWDFLIFVMNMPTTNSKKKTSPPTGLEPVTFRLTAERSADSAKEEVTYIERIDHAVFKLLFIRPQLPNSRR